MKIEVISQAPGASIVKAEGGYHAIKHQEGFFLDQPGVWISIQIDDSARHAWLDMTTVKRFAKGILAMT